MNDSRVQALELSVDLMRTILWQYESAGSAIALAQNDQTFIDAQYKGFWESWFNDVFNLPTANEFGVMVWSRILDYPIVLLGWMRQDKYIWGFGVPGLDPEDQPHANFGNGSFGQPPNLKNMVTVDEARKLLLLRWFQLFGNPTFPQIAEVMKRVFGDDLYSILEHVAPKIISYVFFGMVVSWGFQTAIEETDILPRPAGVRADVYFT